MRHDFTLFGVAALLLCSSAQATELDLNFSGDAARLSGSQPFGNNLQLDAGWLHNTDDGNVGHLGVRLVDLATGGQPAIYAGLGARIVYMDSDARDRSGTAVPLGGTVRMNLPEADRFQIGAYAWFSPGVLSFGSATRYRELGAYVGYEVLRNGSLYLGVRQVNVDFKNTSDVSIDSGLHVGMRLQF